jgi:hypothetical protein
MHVQCCYLSKEVRKKSKKSWHLGAKTSRNHNQNCKNSYMARQGFMAPAPSHSSSSRDVAAGSRTFTHHESTVSSLHRIAEANVAVGGLRNTYDIYILRSPCPTPIAQRKQTSLVGKAFETRDTLQLQLSRTIDMISLHRTVAMQ